MDLDPHAIVLTRLSEDGVLSIRLGHVAVRKFLECGKTVALLLDGPDGEILTTYRRTKKPNGEGSATLETRKKAWLGLMRAVSELAAGEWYLPASLDP